MFPPTIKRHLVPQQGMLTATRLTKKERVYMTFYVTFSKI
jgi:hypothetical protein